MIKARSTLSNGRTLITLGIDARNIERLKENKPIHIHCDQLGFTGELIIFYGETEQDCVDKLKPHINKDTVIHDERDFKQN